jgi:hypothetical protein
VITTVSPARLGIICAVQALLAFGVVAMVAPCDRSDLAQGLPGADPTLVDFGVAPAYSQSARSSWATSVTPPAMESVAVGMVTTTAGE